MALAILKMSVSWILIYKTDIFLLPCPIKYMFGFDCPGCGFQRSVLALLRGDLAQSLQLYPATLPFLLSFACGLCIKFTNGNGNALWLKSLYFFTGVVMLLAYGYKLFLHCN